MLVLDNPAILTYQLAHEIANECAAANEDDERDYGYVMLRRLWKCWTRDEKDDWMDWLQCRNRWYRWLQ